MNEAPSPALAPPPGNPRFALFDGIRGLGLLAVFVGHGFLLTGKLGHGFLGRLAEATGVSGPPMFFLISGFLLYRPYVAARAASRRGPRTARYARRRALRILPAYWVALTLLAIFPGIIGVFTGSWWRYYGLLQQYSQRTAQTGIPVAWTLCDEVAFYVLLPVWAAAARGAGFGMLPGGRRTRSFPLSAELIPIAVVGVAGATVQILAARRLVSALVANSAAGQCVYMALGMGLAVATVVAVEKEDSLRVLRWLGDRPYLCVAGAVAALAGLAAVVPSQGLLGLIAIDQSGQPLGDAVGRIVLTSLFIALLALPATFGDQRQGTYRRLLAARPAVWLGVVSFSFYLYHLPVMEAIAFGQSRSNFSATGLNLINRVHFAHTPILLLITFPIVALIATVSYRLVELPFLRLKEGAAQETGAVLSSTPR